MVDQAMARIVPHVASLAEQPAGDLEGAIDLAGSLFEPVPESGVPFAELLDLLFEHCIPKTLNTAGPGYLAYIPSGGLFQSACADLIAGAVNRYVGAVEPSPALVAIETTVLRWFCDFVGYPTKAGGYLSSGGSLANLTAVTTARSERLDENFLDGTLYASDQVHHSILKAAMLAGFPARRVRQIASDAVGRLSLEALREAVAADRREGLKPFLVVASAGTTNTGAVDDLGALADFAEHQDLWLHVDAAYGGFFILTDRGRRLLAPLARADSITLDPHKGLFLPYGTGCLLVRDREALRRAHHVPAAYMPTPSSLPELVDFHAVSPELSRAFRGLRVWLPIKMHGIEAFRRALDEKLDLAHWVWRELCSMDELEVIAEPLLSIVAFRLRLPHLDLEQANRKNRELLECINRRRRVYMTGTLLGGRFVLRICVLSFRTHHERLHQGLEDLRAAIVEVTPPP